MKKRFDAKRLAALLLCLILSANLLCAPAFAAEKAADDEKAVDWELSEDSLTLKGGSKAYFYYDIYLDSEYFLNPLSVYEYNKEIRYEKDGYTYYLTVYSYARGGDIVWLESNYGEVFAVYVTDEGKLIADKFMNGEHSSARLFDGLGRCSPISEEIFAKLNRAYGTEEARFHIDVTELRDLDKYEIYVSDSTDTLTYTYGIIYDNMGTLIYVEHKDLPNNSFTADGFFSYRKGSVEATILVRDTEADILAVIEGLEYPKVEYDSEKNNAFLGIVAFLLIACIAVVGFVAPIALGILGICLARSKKAGYPKHWYILSVTALVWLIAAAALVIVLLIIL